MVSRYRVLAERFGEGRLADALLAKWLADPEADEQWAHLKVAIDYEIPIPPKLTRMEVLLLELVARGLYLEDAALETGKALSTLKTQMATAMRRLGAQTATEAVAIGIRSGQVRPPTRGVFLVPNMNLRLSPELHQELKHAAQREHRSLHAEILSRLEPAREPSVMPRKELAGTCAIERFHRRGTFCKRCGRTP